MLSVLTDAVVTVAVLAVAWKMAQGRAKGGKSAVKDVATSIVLVAMTIAAVGVSLRHFFE